ncbi:MAG: O-antigen ligase family protein [Thiolinea sp.]
MHKLIYLLFIIHLIFLAYLNNVYLAGIPFRSFLILLTGALVVLHQKEILADISLINRVYVVLMGLGLLISLVNQVTLGSIINGELKLLQSYLVILVSYYIVANLGFRYLAIAFLLVVLPSAVIGILQGLEVNKAWLLHDMLMNAQNKEISDEIQQQIQEALSRPPGLALYAIPQTYMLLSAVIFSSYFVLSEQTESRYQLVLLLLNILLVGGIFASETRSAMGAAVFTLFIVYLYRFRSITTMLAALVVVAGLMIYFIKTGDSSLESRLVSLDDQSAQGRKTLYKYGLELFLQRPWGYGFNFDTVEYAHDFFINAQNIFSYGPHEKAHYIVPVHNSLLNLMHAFGTFGLLIFCYYIYRLLDGYWYRYVFILGALMNSAFHNAGILSGDLFIDMVIGAFLYESLLKKRLKSSPQYVTARSQWVPG